MFKDGQSGNPGGRPKKSNRLAGMCRDKTEQAVQVLLDALTDEKTENRIKASQEILNRGWGKPQEFVEISGDEDSPLQAKITVELIRPNANPDPGGV